MGELSFADPWVFFLLPLVVLLAVRHHRRRAFGALTYSRLEDRDGQRSRLDTVRLHLPFYLRLVALALLLTAAARPQLGFSRQENLTEGIDIQVVLDISGSMAAEDFQPRNRLTVAVAVVKNFVEQRPADRLGLVVFAGSALARVPLTSDHAMLLDLLDGVSLHSLPDGTAIGLALANAAARLKASAARTKVIVLVTDGVNNRGAIDPDSAAAVCEGLGIRVYTVGVGTAGTVPVPMQFRDSDTGEVETRRVMMDVEVDEELLGRIAERTGGRFFKATDPESLRRIFQEVDRLEKTPLRVQNTVRYREIFMPLAVIALALLFLPALLALTGLTAEP